MSEMEYYMNTMSVSHTMSMYEVDTNDVSNFDLDLSQLLEDEQMDQSDRKPSDILEGSENMDKARFGVPVSELDESPTGCPPVPIVPHWHTNNPH